MYSVAQSSSVAGTESIDGGQRGADPIVGVQRDAGGAQGGGDGGQHGGAGVDQQGFHGVADAGPLGLGVQQDLHGHLLVRGGVKEDVHVAFAGLDHGNLGVGHDGLDQLAAAAGNQDVHPAAGTHQDVGAFAAVLVNTLHGVGGQAHRLQGVAEHGDERCVGGGGGGSAAQDDGVAALEAEPGDVHGDVGTRLVDGGDDAHRAR